MAANVGMTAPKHCFSVAFAVVIFPKSKNNGRIFMLKMKQEEARKVAIERQAERMAELKAKMPEHHYKALERVPPRYIGRLSKALTGQAGRKAIIRAMCEQCVGWESTIESISKCSSHICALHPHRPHQ